MRIIISLHIQPKILRKSHVSTIFSEKLIFVNFHVYFQSIQISDGALTLWRHSDVIWSSMVLILVSMNRGGPYLSLVANIGGQGVPYRKSREGVGTTPLRRTCYKNTSGGRVLKSHNILECIGPYWIIYIVPVSPNSGIFIRSRTWQYFQRVINTGTCWGGHSNVKGVSGSSKNSRN